MTASASEDAQAAPDAFDIAPADGSRDPDSDGVDALVGGLEDAPGRRRRIRRLLVANRAVADELALVALYRRVAERGAWLVDAVAASLAVIGVDEEPLHVLRWDGHGSAVATPVSEADDLAITDLARTLERHQVRRLSWPRPKPGMTLPWRSGAIVVPLHYRSDLLAILVLEAPIDRRFTAVDREALSSYAVTAGIAIENARTYEQSRRRQDWLAKATALVNGPLATAGSEQGLRLIAEEIYGLADAERVLLWPDPPRLARVLLTGPRADPADRELEVALNPRHPMVAAALRDGQGLCAAVPEKPREPLARALAGLGLGPVMLFGWDGASGSKFMVVGRTLGRTPFARFDLDLATSFTAQMQAALDLQQARLMIQRYTMLEERERIADSLHDDIVQNLFAAALKLQSLRSLRHTPPAQAKLDDVVRLLDTSITGLRRSILALKRSPAGSAVAGVDAPPPVPGGPVDGAASGQDW